MECYIFLIIINVSYKFVVFCGCLGLWDLQTVAKHLIYQSQQEQLLAELKQLLQRLKAGSPIDVTQATVCDAGFRTYAGFNNVLPPLPPQCRARLLVLGGICCACRFF